MDYTFPSCRTLLDVHIATHTAIGTGEATSRNRVQPAEETNRVTILPVNWESLKSISKSLKTSTDTKSDKVAQQLPGYPDSD